MGKANQWPCKPVNVLLRVSATGAQQFTDALVAEFGGEKELAGAIAEEVLDPLNYLDFSGESGPARKEPDAEDRAACCGRTSGFWIRHVWWIRQPDGTYKYQGPSPEALKWLCSKCCADYWDATKQRWQYPRVVTQLLTNAGAPFAVLEKEVYRQTRDEAASLAATPDEKPKRWEYYESDTEYGWSRWTNHHSPADSDRGPWARLVAPHPCCPKGYVTFHAEPTDKYVFIARSRLLSHATQFINGWLVREVKDAL